MCNGKVKKADTSIVCDFLRYVVIERVTKFMLDNDKILNLDREEELHN